MLDHASVATVLADPATYSSDLSALAPTQSDFEDLPAGQLRRHGPAGHRKLRTLVSQAFTPRVVQGLGPRVEAVCARLLDAVADRDRFDLVDALAYPLPIIVIAELLGIPAEEHRLFQEWAGVLFGGDQLGEAPDMADLERALEAIAPTVREMNGYMLDHIRARRAHPGDDHPSRLIAAEVDGVRLGADQEMVGFVALLLVAGHITTTALLGQRRRHLRPAPRHRRRAARRSARIPAAVEEVLRWLPPFPGLGRRVTRPAVLGGRDIPAGTLLMDIWAPRPGTPPASTRPDVFDAARNEFASDLRARHPLLFRCATGPAGGADRPADVA
ncbi:cytochrome P450 [Streptomyces tricolor]|nr:cytochrome P450 [Streptomyces tricolor]